MCALVLEFCCSEKGELLTMRLKILCEDRCEDIAVNLAAACVRSLRRSDRLRSLSESHHVHYMIDVYIVLLYKLKRTQDIFAQVGIDGRISPRIFCRKPRSIVPLKCKSSGISLCIYICTIDSRISSLILKPI